MHCKCTGVRCAATRQGAEGCVRRRRMRASQRFRRLGKTPSARWHERPAAGASSAPGKRCGCDAVRRAKTPGRLWEPEGTLVTHRLIRTMRRAEEQTRPYDGATCRPADAALRRDAADQEKSIIRPPNIASVSTAALMPTTVSDQEGPGSKSFVLCEKCDILHPSLRGRDHPRLAGESRITTRRK